MISKQKINCKENGTEAIPPDPDPTTDSQIGML